MKPPRDQRSVGRSLAGPSAPVDVADDSILDEAQMEEIQEAVQQIPPMEADPSFRDPLGDYCDNSAFNIIQFLSTEENEDTPAVSPPNGQRGAAAAAAAAPSPQHHQQNLQHLQLLQQQNLQQQQLDMAGEHSNMRHAHPQHMQNQHQQMQQQHPQHLQQQGNNNRQVVLENQHLVAGGRTVLPSSSRLPDSPPITDVSANSSGSPSSSSNSAGSPYSPDGYNYSVLNGNQAGLILGVNDLVSRPESGGAGGPVMLDSLMMPQTGIPAGGGRHQQMQQGAYLHSPYQAQPNQLSPPEMAGQSYGMQQGVQMEAGYGGLDMYGGMMNSMEAANMGHHQPVVVVQQVQPAPAPTRAAPSRKRARNDNQQMTTISSVPLSQVRSQHMQAQQHVFDRSRVKPDPMYITAQPGTSRYGPMTPSLGGMASSPIGAESYMDEGFRGVDGCPQVIKFVPYGEESWQKLYDEHSRELDQITMHVVADKGFNYSSKDQVFVNQKKNHFQVSVNIEANDELPPTYILVYDKLKPIKEMQLSFCGVKSEMHSSEIPIKQSQTDRKPIAHEPVRLNQIPARQLTKVTVPRLHFSETTLNNQRKNNKPNPDQKYFLLMVKLLVVTEDDETHLVQAYASDRIIVRATNPGQFEPPEQEVGWQNADGMMYSHGPVAIGTNQHMGGALSVNGDIFLSGQVQQASDLRLKENIANLDRRQAMDRLNRLRIVEYKYKDEVARAMGMSEQARERYGIIAQELEEVHPQSVHKEGEFLTVDENRMFYDNIAAVQELSKMHENLDNKIDGRVEHMQKTLGRIFRRKPNDGISIISEDSGLANQKGLSTSRYSLASTFKREIAKQSKQEACRNPGCSRSDASSHCSSKLTQGTIVTLVVVMAVCLLSMSALYVLDWHHRNYGIHAIVSPTKTGEDDSLGMMKKTITMPRHQPGAPPLHDMCLHAGCRTFCCDNKVNYAAETRHGGFDLDTVVPLAGSKRAFLAAIAGAEKMTPTAFFPKPLFSGARFEIQGMNMTIDSRYCTERSCNEKKGRYHLFVPVSPYMPTTPVLLRITPPSGMFVQACGHMVDFQEEECPAEGASPHFTLNMPTAVEVESNLFEVSAGAYKRSGYRFRVGTNTESCFGSEERFRSSYDEYNIIFYRACGDDSDQTPTTIEIENERDFGVVSSKIGPALSRI